MLRQDEAGPLLEAHFKTEWAARTAVQWENKPQLKDKQQYDEWLDFTVEFGDSFLKAICGSSKEYRVAGRIIADVHTTKQIGPQKIRLLVSALNDIFRGENISGIRIGAPMQSPELGDETWHRKVISYPFTFDDI